MALDFRTVCDEFYSSCRLYLKLELAPERETVLHFLDRLRKDFPQMQKLRRRDDGGLVLEEESEAESSRRWLRLERHSLRLGFFSPPDVGAVRRLAEAVFEQAPYYLTFSPLDYDHLETVYAFDLEYRGNHDELVAETLWADHPLGQYLLGSGACHAIECQPYLGIALTPDCDLQAYVETKSRTNTYEVRSGEYDRQSLSVFLTVRKYWDASRDGELSRVALDLFDRADELAADFVVPQLVTPLAQAIASRL